MKQKIIFLLSIFLLLFSFITFASVQTNTGTNFCSGTNTYINLINGTYININQTNNITIYIYNTTIYNYTTNGTANLTTQDIMNLGFYNTTYIDGLPFGGGASYTFNQPLYNLSSNVYWNNTLTQNITIEKNVNRKYISGFEDWEYDDINYTEYNTNLRTKDFAFDGNYSGYATNISIRTPINNLTIPFTEDQEKTYVYKMYMNSSDLTNCSDIGRYNISLVVIGRSTLISKDVFGGETNCNISKTGKYIEPNVWHNLTITTLKNSDDNILEINYFIDDELIDRDLRWLPDTTYLWYINISTKTYNSSKNNIYFDYLTECEGYNNSDCKYETKITYNDIYTHRINAENLNIKNIEGDVNVYNMTMDYLKVTSTIDGAISAYNVEDAYWAIPVICSGNEVVQETSTGGGTCKALPTFTSLTGDDIYLYNDSTQMHLNETKLNATIDARNFASSGVSVGALEGNITAVSNAIVSNTSNLTQMIMAVNDTALKNGSNANLTYIQTRVIEFDNVSGTPAVLKNGQMYYTDGNDRSYNLVMNPSAGVIQQIGEEIYLPKLAKNDDTTNILNCEPVYMSGSSGTNILIKHARSDSYRIAQATIGLATQSIDVNAFGRITTYGNVGDCDTSGWVAGTSLFLNRTGGFSSSLPPKNETIVYIGQVLTSNANNGIISVNIIIQPRLDDLSFINFTNMNKSVLIYNNETGIWYNIVLDNYFDTNFTTLQSQINNLTFNSLRDNLSRIQNDSLLQANIDNLTKSVNDNSTFLTTNYYNQTESDLRYLNGRLFLYFFEKDSGIAYNSTMNYTIMNETISSIYPVAQTTYSTVANGEFQMARRISTVPITLIPSGTYSQHTTINYTAGAGTKVVKIHSELYRVNSTGGNLTLIGYTSVPSSPLVVGTYQSVEWNGIIPTDVEFVNGEKLVMILNATVSGVGSPQPTFTLITQGQTGAHLEIGISPLSIAEVDPIAVPLINQVNASRIGNETYIYTNLTALWGNQSLYTLLTTLSTAMSGNKTEWSLAITSNNTQLQANINAVNLSVINNATFLTTNYLNKTADYANDTATIMMILQNGSVINASAIQTVTLNSTGQISFNGDIRSADNNFYYNSTKKQLLIGTRGDFDFEDTIAVYGGIDIYNNLTTTESLKGLSLSCSSGSDGRTGARGVNGSQYCANVKGYAYNGSTYTQRTEIEFFTGGSATDIHNNTGGRIVFATTKVNSTTQYPEDALTINENQDSIFWGSANITKNITFNINASIVPTTTTLTIKGPSGRNAIIIS